MTETMTFEQAYQAMLKGVAVRPLIEGYEFAVLNYDKVTGLIVIKSGPANEEVEEVGVAVLMSSELLDAQYLEASQ